MSYFTKEQEEKAVALILKSCNLCENGDKNGSSARSMAYVERDDEGYVVGLFDLGLLHVSLNDANGGKSSMETPVKARHWNMPSAIGYLTRLRKLTVYYCKSLPIEIIHLADSLQEIAFHFCDELDFDSVPQGFSCLRQLQDFRIHGKNTKTQRILPIHRLQSFSNLRYLYYRGGTTVNSTNENEKEKTDPMLHPIEVANANFRLIQDLLSDDIKFKNSLEILEIEGGDLDEYTVASLFSLVLPLYPSLKRLILPNNKIRSLAPIIAQQPPVIPSSVRLKAFYLMGNPVLGAGNTSPDDERLVKRPEKKYLLQLLSLHEEISCLGHGITESSLCTTEMLLALDLNDGGKILLSERYKPIPLSVWPVVLERVNQRKGYYDNTNVLYHLLRNGPAMGKRCQMARRSSIPPFNITGPMGADDAIGTGTGNAVFTRLPHPSQFSPSCAVGTARPTVTTTTRKRKISMP